MKKYLLKDLKKGQMFTIKDIEYPSDSQVYVKGDYIRSEKKYDCCKCSDILGAGRLFKSSQVVYIDFIY